MPHRDEIQSIIFSKDHWTEKEAKKWLMRHGFTDNYKGKGTDETGDSYRFRQADPLSKGEKRDGFYYTTEHTKKNKGIAFVIINVPKDGMIKEEKKDAKPSSKMTRPIDFGDQLILRKSAGMFNMPIEYQSTISPMYDENPIKQMMLDQMMKNPSLETARSLTPDLFSNLVMQNY